MNCFDLEIVCREGYVVVEAFVRVLAAGIGGASYYLELVLQDNRGGRVKEAGFDNGRE